MAEFSTTKITPSDGVQIPSINGQVAGYQENDELKAYVLGTIPTDVSGHTADIAGIRGTSLDYDPDSTTYIKGATCILNHIVYRAKQLIPSPAGAFDSSKWEEVSLHEIARKVATNTEAITSLTTYSTSEVAWGKWIDGKTIYRKTFVGTSTEGTYSVSLSGLNIDLVVNCEFTIKESNIITIGNYNNDNTYDKQNAYINLTDQLLLFRSGTNYAYGYFIVHLYYTKTS